MASRRLQDGSACMPPKRLKKMARNLAALAPEPLTSPDGNLDPIDFNSFGSLKIGVPKFPEMLEPSQNSRHHYGVTNQIPF
jgi:hypothetical protein